MLRAWLCHASLRKERGPGPQRCLVSAGRTFGRNPAMPAGVCVPSIPPAAPKARLPWQRCREPAPSFFRPGFTGHHRNAAIRCGQGRRDGRPGSWVPHGHRRQCVPGVGEGVRGRRNRLQGNAWHSYSCLLSPIARVAEYRKLAGLRKTIRASVLAQIVLAALFAADQLLAGGAWACAHAVP